jgi:hypothetical protein
MMDQVSRLWGVEVEANLAKADKESAKHIKSLIQVSAFVVS